MPRLLRVIARSATSATLLTLMSGCSFSGILGGDWDLCPNGNEPVGAIRLTPSSASLRIGDEVAVFPSVLDANNSMALCHDPVSMTIDDASIATLVSGRVRGMSVGQTSLRATTGGKTATAIITVTSDALARLDVAASHPSMLIGQVTRVSATAHDSSGNVVTLQSTPWISGNEAVATVTSRGTVIARAPGTAIISLTRGGKTATTSITISGGPPAMRMSAISAGSTYSCALAAAGTVPAGTAFCWGSGANNTGGQDVPARVPGGIAFSSISAGNAFACGISIAGATYCWGWNFAGELGVGTRIRSFTPEQVGGTASYVAVVAADRLACGLLATGRVNCWGAANVLDAITLPAPLAGSLTFVELTSGSGGPGGVCGRTAAGAVYCWSNVSRWNVTAPTLVSGSRTFAAVSVGASYSCGLTTAGSAFCWGIIRDELGASVPAGTYSDPVAVPGGLTYQRIAAAGTFFCGVTPSGTMCHGPTGLSGSSGSGATPQPVPLLDPSTQFVSLSGGDRHLCGLDTQGAVWCWGQRQEIGSLDIDRPREPLQLRFQ